LTLARGTFWSMLLFSRSTTQTHRDLLETVIKRSQLAPLWVHVSGNQGDLADQHFVRDTLRSLWSRVTHLHASAEYIPKTMVFKFLETDVSGAELIPGRSSLIWLRVQGHRLFDTRWLVGPNVTHLSLNWMAMSATHFAWILYYCEGLRDLNLYRFRLGDPGPHIDNVNKMSTITVPPPRSSRLRSLCCLEMICLGQFDEIVAIILDYFALTARNASSIEVARQGWRTPAELASMLILVDLTRHGPPEESALVLGDCSTYQISTINGLHQREFDDMTYGWQDPQPFNSAILGILQRVVHIDIKFKFTRDMLRWLCLWRGETLPRLRSATIRFRVYGGQDDQEDLLLPIAPGTQPIYTPELKDLEFQGHVGSDRSAAQYYIDAPLVRSWSRFCMAVARSFVSAHTINLKAASTREFVVSSHVLQHSIASCMQAPLCARWHAV